MNVWPTMTCLLIGLATGTSVSSPATDAPDPTVPHQALSTLAASPSVRCTGGLLSVKVRDVALAELLDEIGSQCGFVVTRYVVLEQRLSVEFHGLTLEQALWRLLSTRSYALKYAPQPPGPSPATGLRAETLWILPQGNERLAIQLPMPVTTSRRSSRAESELDTSRWIAALGGSDVEDRQQAVAALGKRGRTDAVAPLSQALADDNAQVRQTVIASLVKIGGADAARALVIALSDADPRTRELAVEALGEIGGDEVAGPLQQALTDDVAFVRQAAAEQLEQLRRAAP